MKNMKGRVLWALPFVVLLISNNIKNRKSVEKYYNYFSIK